MGTDTTFPGFSAGHHAGMLEDIAMLTGGKAITV
jgi:hypothetical protein